MLESYVARPGEFLDGQGMFLVSGIELFNPPTNSPLRSNSRRVRAILSQLNSITTKIRTTTFRRLDMTAGYDPLDHRSDFTYLVVFLGATDIEGLIMNKFSGSLKRPQTKARAISSMCTSGTPGRPIASNQNLPGSVGKPDEIVHH